MTARQRKSHPKRVPAKGEFGRPTRAGTFRIERLLPGPIERVWAYLTDSEKRKTWLASGLMELRVGGRVELDFRFAELTREPPPAGKDAECKVTGRVTRCEPPHRLSYTWGEEPEASEVTFRLSVRHEDVLLVIVHRRLGDRGTIANVGSGWHAHLGLLVDHLHGRVSRPFWAIKVETERVYGQRLADARP